jgi:hypothetical protein
MHSRSLWLAVIKQALEDRSPSVKLADRTPASYWRSKDFSKACELAQVEPAAVRKANGIA